MTLRLYDTRAQALREFLPLDENNVTMYVCGPTVQSGPHVGHLRAALSFDLLRRWLEHRYGRVTYVRNVTDIDDKVLQNVTDGEPWWALAYRMEREFTAAYDAIDILPPTYEPRATASIPQMQDFIQRLIDRGHAYAAGGDVYFDVSSWPSYGALTRQDIDAMVSDETDLRGKRDAHDFALWKGAKPDEPADASWSSPWGAGRPGWHIECSAMSLRYVGAEFDIHGGGLDLRFPHHENELAQSEAAGDPFARYWMHNGLVTAGGQKMSKSIGNVTLVRDVLSQRPARVVRYALAAAHYRSSLDLSESSWAEAASAMERIRTFLARAERVVAANQAAVDEDGIRPDVESAVSTRIQDLMHAAEARGTLPEAFSHAMDDDLSVPQALAVLHETVRGGNSALDSGDEVTAEIAYHQVKAMTTILAIDPVESGDVDDKAASALDAVVRAMIEQRAEARENKDWATADRIRDLFADIGVVLEDTRDGTVWSIDG